MGISMVTRNLVRKVLFQDEVISNTTWIVMVWILLLWTFLRIRSFYWVFITFWKALDQIWLQFECYRWTQNLFLNGIKQKQTIPSSTSISSKITWTQRYIFQKQIQAVLREIMLFIYKVTLFPQIHGSKQFLQEH